MPSSRRRSAWEKAQLYMCLGGVPKYLEQIDPKSSIEKNLNRLCFSAGGFFIDEFEKGNKTVVEISNLVPGKLDDKIFTKAYLENLSK